MHAQGIDELQRTLNQAPFTQPRSGTVGSGFRAASDSYDASLRYTAEIDESDRAFCYVSKAVKVDEQCLRRLYTSDRTYRELLRNQVLTGLQEIESEAVEAVEDAREETASAATREATLGFAPPGTPAKVTLELSSDSSDGEVVDSPNVREGALDEGEVTSGVKTVEAEEDSGAEGVFDVAIRRELEDKETSSPVAAARSEVSALREEVERLRDELDGAKWSREALEARVVEAEKIAADARSKTIETALDPQNQLTPEQVAALRAEIEQVEYLKRLLARAEQMRNTARAETKKAREKHEQDLEIVRREVAAMDEEIDNLRKRVKNDKSKMDAMERATIEAADEFATLYARQENTRRLLAAAFFAVVLLVIRLFMSGGAFTLKNMYNY